MSEARKLEQREYKIRYDWIGKVINCELCKKVKPSHTTKSYMNKPKSVLENITNKIFRDFEIQTDLV